MSAPSSGPWYVSWGPESPSGLPLICFPWAGAGAAVYREWAGWVAEGVEVWAARLPARETRFTDPLPDTLGELVSQLADGLDGLAGRPYALFGQCSGALVAFELAGELRRRGLGEPRHLAVAAATAPRRTHLYSDRSDDLRSELRTMGLLTDDVLAQDELFELLAPAMEGDLRLGETYVRRDEPPLRCPVTAFVGFADEYVVDEDLRGWSEETEGRFEIVELPGDHLFSAESSRTLAEAVSAAVAGT
jgi:medium-chain acyl-[acyl-carrier-protein] hydrolase